MTLKQVINRIQGIAENHGMLKSFYQGDPWELEHQERGHTEYACLLLQMTAVSLQKGQTRLDFSFYFMDQVTAEEHNELDVLSDMLQVAQDVVAQLRDPVYEDWLVSDTNSGVFFVERFESSTAGLRVDVAVIIEDPGDRCAVPANV